MRADKESPKFGPVGPIELLHYMHFKLKWNIGKYFLFIPSDIMREPTMYRELVVDLREKRKCTIILDNDVFENPPLGADYKTMAFCINVIKPDVISLPEEYLKGPESVSLALDGLHQFIWPQLQAQPLFIPQGSTWDEWHKSLYDFWKGTSRSIRTDGWTKPWIGVARNLYDIASESRFKACEAVHHLYGQHTSIHLMGMSNSARDDLEACAHPAVHGIDSAKPLRKGMFGVTMQQDIRMRRGNWWEATVNLYKDAAQAGLKCSPWPNMSVVQSNLRNMQSMVAYAPLSYKKR